MADLKIQEAEIKDIYNIGLVQKTTWLATYVNEENNITTEDILSKNFIGPDRIAAWEKSFLENNGNRKILVAKEANLLIGFCISEKCLENNKLKALYVLPEYQGHGVGKRLISEALNWLGNYKDIILGVVKYNHKAINFYKKFGFFESGDLPFAEWSKLPSGKSLPEIKMIKNKNS
jgi:GNAT superfamily N-acetyltransferase